jgi:hypothetical protein
MPRPSLFLILRTLQWAISLCLVAYVIWRFANGQHAGDTASAGVIVVTTLSIAIEAYRRRKVR